MMNLPEQFEEQMKDLLGEEWETFQGSYQEHRHYGLRLNTLKASSDILKKVLDETHEITWSNSGYYYKEEERPGKHPYYNAGCYYIQEPSAMTPATALGVEAGDCVIDLCAAPGGKSTQIAAELQGQGLLVTNDISPSRVKALNKNIQINGVRNALVLSEDPVKLAKLWPSRFDKVIVDAPCSGEGMFRKEPKLMQAWMDEGPEVFVPIQRSILTSADQLLKSGGELVYSTCTYNIEENELNIKWFLEQHPDYELIDVPELIGIEKGMDVGTDLTKTGRVWPHKMKGEGHYVAKLRKVSEAPNPVIRSNKGKTSAKQLEAIRAFNDEIGFSLKGYEERLNVIKDTVYLLPEMNLETKGLRVFANGWLLGTFKKDRFEPSQAYASGLLMADVKRAANLDYDQSVRYLKGETIPFEYSNGWVLVTIDGYSLGWGKVVNNRLKNKLEPSWRWR